MSALECGVPQATDPPSEFADVLSRWQPDGWRRLAAVTDGRWDPRRIAVVGEVGAGKSELIAELVAYSPELDLSGSPDDSGVLLVVLDAAAPAKAPLDVPRTPGRRVVFALNKIDVHEDWAVVRGANMQALGAQFGGPQVIVPVSARLAATARIALADTDSGVRMRVLAASGVPGLARQLAAALPSDAQRARSDHHRDLTRTVADQAADSIRAMVRSLGDGDDITQPRAERARLLASRDGGRTEAVAALRSQVQLARVDVVHEVGAQVRALNGVVRARVDDAAPRELADLASYLDSAVAELTERLDAWTTARIAQLARRVANAAADGLWGPAGGSPRVGPPPPRARHTVESRLTIALGASAGVGLGRLAVAPLTMIPALDALTIPLTLVLGAGAAWWFTRSRAQVAERAQLRQWAAEALVEVKAQLEQRMVSALVEAEALVAEDIVRRAGERAALVDVEVGAIDAEIRRLGSARSGRMASCRRDLAAVEEGLRAISAGKEPERDAVRL
ncbi:hypothetical protein [Aldersonia kunmingensis]|uniref:hypothetical protein n=1 Tax=Aldersonia kunmingensis TaxID=408066 RepID=UPI0008299E65|nr:hypothetical protein [Aldersonia kunmingensis]